MGKGSNSKHLNPVDLSVVSLGETVPQKIEKVKP